MVKAGRKVVTDPIGYHCINLLVQRAVATAKRKACARARGARWNDANRSHISDTSRALYEKKRDQRISETTEYRRQNRAHLMKKQCEREKKRRETDGEFLAATLLRQRLRGALGREGISKDDNTLELIGCSISDFNAHIDSQCDFEGPYELDHIFPFAKYNLELDQRRVMHYTNYQPLTVEENRQKWNKLPTKAMAAKVDPKCWPDGVTMDMLPDVYSGWATPLRMHA